jgi:uncharacterized surface protein with fasciclin (FAS1) repeats
MKALKIILLIVVSLTILGFAAILNPDKTISEKITEKEDLSTLSAALEAADLLEVLKGEGPYTVFAPTNKAFDMLPEGKLEDLLKPEHKEELVRILKNHVVAGKIYAANIEAEQMIETLGGTQLKITVHSSSSAEEYVEGEAKAIKKVMVNNVMVAKADMMASNGIIHLIDGVVMPSGKEVLGAIEMEQNEKK